VIWPGLFALMDMAGTTPTAADALTSQKAGHLPTGRMRGDLDGLLEPVAELRGMTQLNWLTVELVVITGGEPLIQQKKLNPLVQGLLAAGKRVEFETNGTIAPKSELLVDGIHFNVSPKLANSGVEEDKRIVPDALMAFAASGRAAFKFVTRTVAELSEIGALVDRYGLDPVWVMPEGTTAEGLIETTRVLADAVAVRRWRFTPRLHVLAFAEARGR
jgi:organic radical activating enzyme